MKFSKRILSFLMACLTMLSVITVIPVTVSAETYIAPEDNSIPLQTATTTAQTSPDGFFIDGVMQNNQAGGEAAHTWLNANGYKIEDKNAAYGTIALYGWTNTEADNIAAYGYEINGQQVWNATKTVTYYLTEGTVNTANCPNNIAPDFGLSGYSALAKRAFIEVNVGALAAGVYNITPLIKLTDNSIYAIATWGTVKFVKYGPARINQSIDAFTTSVDGGLNVYQQPADSTSFGGFDAKKTIIGVKGWIGYIQSITAFGYYFDGNPATVVYNDAFFEAFANADDQSAILSAGGGFAKRFNIQANMASLTAGDHTVTYVAKLSGGSIETIATLSLPGITVGSTADFTGAAVRLGSDLSIDFYAILPSSGTHAVRVTMNNETTYLPSTTATLVDAATGEYLFRYEGITPQCMGDAIDIALVPYNTATGQATGDPIATKNGYSVKTNLTNLQTAYQNDPHVLRLIADTLSYGAVAQSYVDHHPDSPILTGVDTSAGTSIIPGTADNAFQLTTSTAGTKITSGTVCFERGVNRLRFSYAGTDANVTVKINGTVYPATAEGSRYIVYGNALSALDFDKLQTVELLVNGTVVQTLTYSVNTYAYRTYNSTTATEADKALALALYRYGKSVENYASSIASVEGVTYRLNADDQSYTLASGAGFSGSALTIPSTVNGLPVTAMAAGAFQNKTNLTSITIPASITVISDNAFAGCTALSAVFLPSNLTTIGKAAFSGCTSLTSFTFPGSVSTIGELAFYNCTAINTFTIPASVTSMGARCFEGCSALTTINYGNTSAAWKALVAPATGWNTMTGNYTVWCTNNEKVDKNNIASSQNAVSGSLRIISFNVYVYGSDGATNLRLDGTGASKTIDWATRGGYLKQFVQKYMPDSIGMQEVNQNWLNTFSSSGVFSSFTASDGTAYAYKGVTADRGDGEHSAIYYNSNKYKAVESGHFWLSDTPDVAGSTAVTYNGTVYTSKYIRICHWVRLRDKTTGYEYVHINTHLDTASNNVRRGQTQVLLAKIIDKFGTDTPMFITGDFNSTPLGSTNGVYERRGLHNNMTGKSSFTYAGNGTKYRSPFADTRLEAAKIILRNPETNADQTYSGGTWTIDTATGEEYYGDAKMPIASETKRFIQSFTDKYDPYGRGPIDYIFFNRNCFTAQQYKAQIYEKSGDLISDHLPLICDYSYYTTVDQVIG